MDKIFIRERLNIVDYDNNNKGLIFTSSGIDIEGGAININIESDVAGWYQLTFDMPAFLIKDGKQINNPILDNLFPLTKIQYTRIVKQGDEENELILYFIVQPQVGSRDDSGIVLQNFTCIDYPRHNLSKAKMGITIGEDTLDNARSMTPNNEIMNVSGKICYVKAPVQSWLTVQNYAALGNLVDALPGAFAYIPSLGKGYRLIGTEPGKLNGDQTTYTNWFELQENETYTTEDGNIIPDAVWCPDWNGYPLAPDPNAYDYGQIGIVDLSPSLVQFYWDITWLNPDKTVGRYDGLLYKEGSRLVYGIYDSLDYEFPDNFLGTYYKSENLKAIDNSYIVGTTAYVLETGTVWSYNGDTWEDTYQNKREAFKVKEILKGDWDKLDPMKAYLAPNYADKYLDYILEGTGWTVGTVDRIMVDNGTIAYGDNGEVEPEKIELSTYLYFDNSNAYNAINELCTAFGCYARFDHVNKRVNLKAIPGEDNNLVYQYRDNLNNSRVTQDGEKAVSKLWVYGGEDLDGQVYIQDCNRMNPDYYIGDYTSMQDLQTRYENPTDMKYAKVTTSYTWAQLVSQTLYEGQRLPIANQFLAGELTVTSWGTGIIPTVQSLSDLPSIGSLGQTVFVLDQNSYWSWFPEGSAWYDTFVESEPIDNTETVSFNQRYDYQDSDTSWHDKGQFYHWYEPLSPYADNYIMDFRYFRDRHLMTQAQEDDIKYNYVLPISRLNRKRWPLYTQYSNLNNQLLTWNATYDECKIARDAIDKSLRTTYSIYQSIDGIKTLKETGIYSYPPGASFKAGSTYSADDANGWILADMVYSSSDAPAVTNYSDIATTYPNPSIGDYVRVSSEAQVYYYANIYSYDDTISEYLGWNRQDVWNQGPSQKNSLLLFSPGYTSDSTDYIEARIRDVGLFQKFRDEELADDVTTTRTSIAPWGNPTDNIKDLPPGPTGDPKETSNANAYYDAKNRYVTEQINMNDALDRVAAIETEMTLLIEKIEGLETLINSYERSLRENYGDFIVEGTFTDDTMVWIYNLWYAGLEALELYHRPLITYELGVTDVSGLPEYRTATSDIYHDIVYRLNQPELVLPNPGDYCYVTDNKLGIVRERANITSVTRNLSNPSQHQITIATVDTNTEDLIGKLVTAANTMYSKEQIYNRSAIINSNGTIATDSLSSSLDNNSGEMTILSNSGTVKLGDNGILTTDRDNGLLRMQYTGKGIFSSSDGGTTWNNIINQGKISIKSLSAGTIDSNNISVSNIGHDSSIIIDGKGITALNYTGDFSSSPTLVDPTHTAFFLDAKTGNAYFRGTITAGSGNIGGWKINSKGLYYGSSISGATHALLNSGQTYTIDGVSRNNIIFKAGNNFGVDTSGSLFATGATITGVINATSGKIGNWNISGGALSNGNVQLTADGNLIANGVTINSGTVSGTLNTGNLTATGGTIGGWSISDVQLHKLIAGRYRFEIRSDRGSGEPSLLVYDTSYSRYNWYVRPDGYMYARSANISGTLYSTGGSIAGWTLSEDGFYSGNSRLRPDGRFEIYPQVGSGGEYVFNNGMKLHSTSNQTYTSGGNINMSAVNIAIEPSGSGYVRLGPIYFYKNSQSIYSLGPIGLDAGGSSFCWATSGSGINGKIKTTAGDASSKILKTNISEFIEDDYNEAYNLLKDIKLYDYDYKYNIYKDKHQYGFIIDQLLEQKNANKFFRFYDEVADVRNGKFDGIGAERDKIDPSNPPDGYISYKSYDENVLDKYLLVCLKSLQIKIDSLERQIKKMSN